ncbi:MAG: alanine/ornithine racemase family PLP-dependent enzyme [Candidatus Thiodiazotropha sp. (ex Lucinoma borealis)]|nr:alanine/ornithine racemase family PLP-dependent enzyme [Candidatus Thiodiazotropha sp. (ex Lucinoma borealis)]MCU7866148.1 alanine/ornithine racemase family PLP-dependent enzyme [Candidatus Thiodiazotropha sp. (ex Lucinoma borealis)]MCU7868936.1 alanine/ornithine racemase family PLP-dependent enzyme [Candidatus Thiodiazotropha sp. (ex Lucinoma borealis)]
MAAPRLEIDLDKIYHNASTLVKRLAGRGISVTGVTKVALGSADIASTMLRAGVKALGDSRIENIEAMRLAQATASMTLIRSPMLSQVKRVVMHADVSCNSEIEVIRKLSFEAQKADRTHGAILMVELGDLREGIMPGDLADIVRETLSLPNILFKGIGTNLACRSGVSPDARNMAVLSELADALEESFGLPVEIVSGGNSANLEWALSGAEIGRINDLRLGEAILLGCETLHRQPIDGLHTDAITLSAEVIEAKLKPSLPSGTIAQTAFGEAPPVTDRGLVTQAILAIGQQDIDPCGLTAPAGINIMGASSDHLILEVADYDISVGEEVTFQLNYSALVRAMTSPFVTKLVRPASRHAVSSISPQELIHALEA